MNYYPFHIGDFAAHTAHLTWEEDIAYRRALDWYYLNEKALPEEAAKVARLIRMPKSVAVIEAVLAEFFVKADDGWHNKRADQELASMAAKQEQQGAKDEHEAERMKRHRERRAQMFGALRQAGVVPAWDVPMKELQRLYNENCNAPATDLQREQAVTVNAPATAIPIPTPTPTPIPVFKEEDSARKRTPPAARPPNVSEQVWRDFTALRKTKRAPITATALSGTQAEADKAGICLDAALAYCCAVGWQAFNAAWYAERMADQPTAKAQAAPRETFRERDKRLEREAWEQMTGRQHPDNPRADVQHTGPATTIATASIARPKLAAIPLETTA